jgi:hypothetical protein
MHADAISPQTKLSALRVTNPTIIETITSTKNKTERKRNSLSNNNSFCYLIISGLINPRIKGTIEVSKTIDNASGELKKRVITGAKRIIRIVRTIPRKIDTTHAESMYSFKSLFSCTRKTLIPVSVRISRRERRRDAMPKKPNSTGVSSLPSTESRRIVIILVRPRNNVIQDTPLSASDLYPILVVYQLSCLI